jgi:5-methylcytosine-specific restriction endonuclease McrA
MAQPGKKLDRIWEKGTKVGGKNSDLYRKDPDGKVIYKPSYGKTSSMGWEVDHKKPRSKGGTDNIRNLVPRHWESNREKSGKY